MKFRDLEKVRRIVMEATGLDISYAYDDLVFPDHTAFLIHFNDDDEYMLHCYFHVDCIRSDQEKILKNLQYASKNEKYSLHHQGSFSFKQREDEVDITFFPN